MALGGQARRAVVGGTLVAGLVLGACSPSAPASPTAAPAKPTTAAGGAAASPAAKPAASPAAGAAASPATKPAASPGASPAAKPAASPAAGGGSDVFAAAAEKLRAQPLPPVDDAAAAQHFRGKTVTISIGYAPGGGADTQARLLAEHLQKHIPGNPSVAVTNQPGADSLVNAQQTMRKAKDGLNIGHFSQGILLQKLTGKSVEGFNPLEPTYLGMVDAGGGPSQICARTDVANSLDAFLKSPSKLKLAETSPASNPAPVIELLKIAGAPIETVYGYGGTSELRAAFDRKESELTNRCGDPDLPRFPHWIEQNFATPLFYWGPEPPEVMKPLLAQGKYPWYKHLSEVITLTPAQKQALETYVQLNGVHVHMLPPGVPENTANALKRAYILAMSDPQFVQDLRGRGQDYAPIGGDQMRARVQDVEKMPSEVLEIIGKMVQGGN